jgi:hypothetical protein
MRPLTPLLVRPDGTVGRGVYAGAGLLLFAVKHNIDRFVASVGFRRPWGLFNYLVPPEGGVPLTGLGADSLRFYGTLVAISLPFIAVGVVLTLGRLRDAGLPAGLVLLFFAPVLNLAFFLLLSLVPPRRPAADASGPPASRLARIIPDSALGSAALAMALVAVFGVAAVILSVSAFEAYGWGLFVGIPFAAGLAAAVLYGYHRPRSYWGCVGVALMSVVLLGAALLALAVEGFLCLWMAGPLLAILAWMGGTAGYFIQRRDWRPRPAPAVLAALAIFLPVLMGAERVGAPPAPLFAVRTAVEVDAPPEAVWARVVSFGQLPEPEEWLFRMGIAYPRPARADGGVDAVSLRQAAPPRGVLRVGAGRVPAHTARWRPHAPGRNHLVPTPYVARRLLAAMVRRRPPPHSPSRASAHQTFGRSTLLSKGGASGAPP